MASNDNNDKYTNLFTQNINLSVPLLYVNNYLIDKVDPFVCSCVMKTITESVEQLKLGIGPLVYFVRLFEKIHNKSELTINEILVLFSMSTKIYEDLSVFNLDFGNLFVIPLREMLQLEIKLLCLLEFDVSIKGIEAIIGDIDTDINCVDASTQFIKDMIPIYF
jgi:hypothetical protein